MLRIFDEKYRYDGKDLGANCSDGKTTFKVWSPFAKKIELCLYKDNDYEVWQTKELQRENKGVWRLTFDESLHGIYYDYLIEIDEKKVRTADPYAKACGCNGKRSMVVDLGLTNPEGFETDAAPPLQEEQIIYELHIKDFSYDSESGIPKQYRGKYKAFTVNDTKSKFPTCMKYLKELGVTHVQLLPFYDYGSVDEAGDDKQYNWGYDPLNYNVPEGSYATDVSDGVVRIRECKEMIQAFHANGLRVVMDVVYNHTYQHDSWLQRTVPDYYYRYNEDGYLSNGSGCGNDVAAGRAMVDNYIVDSVMYWAREYHIDGFRFDLMGLLTTELINRIKRKLDESFGKGEKLLYGEPWSAGSSPMEKGTMAALKKNIHYLDDGIGIFCDNTRDLIKGNSFVAKNPGAVNGGKGLDPFLLNAVNAWCGGGADFCPKSCAQIINYVSAHDNFTLWDKLVMSMCENPNFTERNENVIAANKLAAFIYFTCQGRLFMQAGEEFGRTKLGDGNSYRSAPELNMLKWRQTVEFSDLVEYYKGLIRLRKRLPGLYDKSVSAAKRIRNKEIVREGIVSFLVDNRNLIENRNLVDNRDSSDDVEWNELYVVYNMSDSEYTLILGEGVWQILADAETADCRRDVTEADRSIKVAAHSGMLLGRLSERTQQ
ncbi:MAG: type I pullulanase [Clostridiales bacterium]|nr:type I pullulanase [Clostridiales bacterium]